jgi:hypothetical protein
MSFDLYFYKRTDSPVTESDVATYLTNYLPFNKSDYARQWDYENPTTGVYFLIDWNKADEEDEEFEGFTNLHFSFSLNFFRPVFFGLESFPVVEKFVNDLDLFIFDPQDVGEMTIPSKFPNGHLKDEWILHNDKVTLDQFEKLKFKYMSVEKSNYVWQFLSQKNKIECNLKEDIFVTDIFVVESKRDGQLYTVGMWPTHIPIILPRVDFVMIKKSYKKFFKRFEESGPVHYDTIINKLGTYFEDFENNMPDLKILTQNNADKIKDKFNALKIEGTIAEFGRVSLDNFVNVRLR